MELKIIQGCNYINNLELHKLHTKYYLQAGNYEESNGMKLSGYI
jgi:hypothetical protein